MKDMISEELEEMLEESQSPEDILISNQRVSKENSMSLRGFFMYSSAIEIYAVVSISLFIPILLEQWGRENSFISPSHEIPCPSLAFTVLRCKVKIESFWIEPSSYSLFIYSVSVLVQAVAVISIGSFADNPITRHRLMISFGAAGSLFSILILFLPQHMWQYTGLLAIGGNVSQGCSAMCLNSFLPELAANSDIILRKRETISDAQEHLKSLQREGVEGTDLEEALTNLNKLQGELILERQRVVSRISSGSIATGYGAGIAVLLLLLLPVSLMKGSTTSLRLAVSISGVFWGLGTIPASMWLKPSNAPPWRPTLMKLTLESFLESTIRLIFDLIHGWKTVIYMLKDWRRLPSTFLYLAAWFLLSDAFNTVTSTAILFAKTSLYMDTSSLIIIAALTPASGIAGAILFPKLQKDYLGWSNQETLTLLVGMAIIVPIWAIVALEEDWEMYFLSMYFGAIYGSFQSYARSCYSELIPPGQAARWFSLFSITDKSSSFLGPALVGLITNTTGSIRNGFYIIVIMLLCSIPVLNLVDSDQGRKDAEIYSGVGISSSNGTEL